MVFAWCPGSALWSHPRRTLDDFSLQWLSWSGPFTPACLKGGPIPGGNSFLSRTLKSGPAFSCFSHLIPCFSMGAPAVLLRLLSVSGFSPLRRVVSFSWAVGTSPNSSTCSERLPVPLWPLSNLAVGGLALSPCIQYFSYTWRPLFCGFPSLAETVTFLGRDLLFLAFVVTFGGRPVFAVSVLSACWWGWAQVTALRLGAPSLLVMAAPAPLWVLVPSVSPDVLVVRAPPLGWAASVQLDG